MGGKHKWQVGMLFFFALLLNGCDSANPGDTPTAVIPATEVIAATLVPEPVLTVIPTLIDSPEPTVTRTSLPTFTPNMTPTLPPAAIHTPVPEPLVTISPDNAAHIVELARWGQGIVRDVAYSANGRYIAVYTASDKYLYDAEVFEPVSLTTELLGESFPRDVNALMAEPIKGAIKIKKASNDTVLSTLTEENVHMPVTFSPDWELVVAEIDLNVLGIWQTANGKLLYTVTLVGEGDQCYGGVTDVTFSSDGQMLAAGCTEHGRVYIWRVLDGGLVRVLDANDWIVFSIAFSPDGTRLASMQTGGAVSLWRVSDGALLDEMDDSQLLWVIERGATMAFSPNGTGLLVGYPNGEVLVYRTRDGKLLRRLHEAAPSGESVVFSNDGELVAVGAWDSVLVWRTSDGSPILSTTGFGNSILTVAHRASPMIRSGPSGEVIGVSISPDGQFLAATFVTWENTLKLWRVHSDQLQPLDSNDVPQINWLGLTYSPDGQTIAGIVEGTGPIQMRRVGDWTILDSFSFGGDDFVADFMFSADGQTMVAVSYYGNVRVWRLADGEQLLSFDIQGEHGHSVALSPDGESIAVGGDNTIDVFSANDGALLYRLEGSRVPATDPNKPVYILALEFSPDSQTIASAWPDGSIRLWRAGDGTLLHILEGHREYVLSLAFSSDGRFLASGSRDGTVRVWGVAP